jgi:hypothetical protein
MWAKQRNKGEDNEEGTEDEDEDRSSIGMFGMLSALGSNVANLDGMQDDDELLQDELPDSTALGVEAAQPDTSVFGESSTDSPVEAEGGSGEVGAKQPGMLSGILGMGESMSKLGNLANANVNVNMSKMTGGMNMAAGMSKMTDMTAGMSKMTNMTAGMTDFASALKNLDGMQDEEKEMVTTEEEEAKVRALDEALAKRLGGDNSADRTTGKITQGGAGAGGGGEAEKGEATGESEASEEEGDLFGLGDAKQVREMLELAEREAEEAAAQEEEEEEVAVVDEEAEEGETNGREGQEAERPVAEEEGKKEAELTWEEIRAQMEGDEDEDEESPKQSWARPRFEGGEEVDREEGADSAQSNGVNGVSTAEDSAKGKSMLSMISGISLPDLPAPPSAASMGGAAAAGVGLGVGSIMGISSNLTAKLDVNFLANLKETSKNVFNLDKVMAEDEEMQKDGIKTKIADLQQNRADHAASKADGR